MCVCVCVKEKKIKNYSYFCNIIYFSRPHIFLNVSSVSSDKEIMDCEIVVSEFVLQSRYYVHFRANTLGKGMNPLILPAMG